MRYHLHHCERRCTSRKLCVGGAKSRARCEEVARTPERIEVQSNGWTRRWKFISEAGKYLRVIVLEDGETLHNAFFDRRYRGKVE